MQPDFLPNGHEDAFITPEYESQLWERRLRREVGVAPMKYVNDFHGNLFILWAFLLSETC
jgi:hypothetical protein